MHGSVSTRVPVHVRGCVQGLCTMTNPSEEALNLNSSLGPHHHLLGGGNKRGSAPFRKHLVERHLDPVLKLRVPKKQQKRTSKHGLMCVCVCVCVCV